MNDELKQRLLRPAEAMKWLGLKRTAFDEHFVKTGRLRKVRITPRSVGFLAADVAAVVQELAAAKEPQKTKARYRRPAADEAEA